MKCFFFEGAVPWAAVLGGSVDMLDVYVCRDWIVELSLVCWERS